MEEQYGFSIDSTTVKEIIFEGRISYTMLIRREINDSNIHENLIVQIDSLNNTIAFIAKYDSSTDSETIHDSYELDRLIDIIPIEYNSDESTTSKMVYGCTDMYEIKCTGGSGPGICDGRKHIPLTDCFNRFSNCMGYTLTGSSCEFYDDGTSTSGGGTNTPSPPSGPGHSGPSGGGIFTSNVKPQLWQDVALCINGSLAQSGSNTPVDNTTLTIGMLSWLQEDKRNSAPIANYLANNNCSEESQAFAIYDILTYMNPYISPEDEQISVDLLTDDCTKLIVRDEIIGDEDSVGTNANLLNSIRNTFSLDNNVNLVFRNTDDVPADANASTDFDSDENIDSGVYDIYITFSNDYLAENPTKLSRALITIHEMVHAKLMYSYLQGTLLTEYPEYTNLNAMLIQFLENRNIVNGQALNDAMHIAMVDFIGSMSYSLYQYAQNSGMTNITHQYCKEITKGSFYGTPAMPLIDTGDSSAEELGIKTQNEQNNEPNAQGDDC